MRKREIDQLLEAAVARAIGVSLPSTSRPRERKAARKVVDRAPVRHEGVHAHA